MKWLRRYTFSILCLLLLNGFTTNAQQAKLISLDSLNRTAAINAIYVSQVLYNNQNYISQNMNLSENFQSKDSAELEIIRNTLVQAISYYSGSGEKSIANILKKYPAIYSLYFVYFFQSLSDSEIHNAVQLYVDGLPKDDNSDPIKKILTRMQNNDAVIVQLESVKSLVLKAQIQKDSLAALVNAIPALSVKNYLEDASIDSLYKDCEALISGKSVKDSIDYSDIRNLSYRLKTTIDAIKQKNLPIDIYADERQYKQLFKEHENDAAYLFNELKIELLKLASGTAAEKAKLGNILPGKDKLFKRKADYFLTSLESRYNVVTNNQVSFFNEYITNAGGGSSFSLPSQTEMIDAVAIFLAKRTKQEAILWFFEQLRNKSKINKEINAFFPECMALLNNGEVYEMPEMGKAWRYAIAKDFVNMPENFFKSPFATEFLSKNGIYSAQLQEYIWYASYVAKLMQKKYTTEDIINNLYINLKDNYLSNVKATPGHFITLLYALKQEFYTMKDGNKQWLHPSVLMDMPDDVLKTILSLVDLKYSGVFSKLLLPQGKPFDFDAMQLNQVRRLLGKMLQGMQQIKNVTVDLKKANGDDNTEAYNYSIWQFTNELVSDFDEVLSITHNPKILDTTQIYNLQTCLYTFREILSVYALIDNKNYNNAVNKMFDVVLTLVNNNRNAPKIKKILADINEITEKGKKNPAGTDYYKITQLTTRLKNRISSEQGVKPTPEKLFPFLNVYNNDIGIRSRTDSIELLKYYLSYDKTRSFILNITKFFSDVATAKNSQDLSKVVSAYALPATSYKLKRNTWNSVFINGYVGIYGGYEQLTNTQFHNAPVLNDTIASGWVYGVSAPIGISFSKTFGKARGTRPLSADAKFYPGKDKNRFRDMSKSTLTVFVSIIDLGAVVSYRFSNTQGTLPQEFKWSQFISPGLHLQYGIPGTPLLIGSGVVYTPQIRKVDASVTGQTQQYNAIRAYTGLFFDIPLVTIHSKEKYKGLKLN
ncbi:MAG: hypothetical protein JST82_04515 [Bacteroidetes bacterium]|nr:hypothetical protein [Bacteroidota bacterium]